MPTVTDWLMVVITLFYVIATICICVANFKSAAASKKQLEESQEQFKKNNRPRVDVEFFYEKRKFFGLRFANHGNMTAQKVSIRFDDAFIDSLDELHFQSILKRAKDKECVIGVGQHHDIFIGSKKLRENHAKNVASGVVVYYYNGEQYESKFNIDIDNYMSIYSVKSEQEELIKEIQEQNKLLQQQNEELKAVTAALTNRAENKEPVEI
ncbi:MAG: hypothetical protein IJJ41_07625 [Clostridia bacterium]|nr:hypothetical protein [Clostridia bacterium]